jgi:hypothetical protein
LITLITQQNLAQQLLANLQIVGAVVLNSVLQFMLLGMEVVLESVQTRREGGAP